MSLADRGVIQAVNPATSAEALRCRRPFLMRSLLGRYEEVSQYRET